MLHNQSKMLSTLLAAFIFTSATAQNGPATVRGAAPCRPRPAFPRLPPRSPAPPPPPGASCGGSFNNTSVKLSPPSPQAGDTVVLNATGVETGAVLSGGSGVINAFLFGDNVFTAPVNTCGYTDVNVLGIADGSLYGPACSAQAPLMPGQPGTISFSMRA